jgi:hypothetical protein
MRIALIAVVMASHLAVAAPAHAEPASTCPPACNRIPEAAWVAAAAIPLYSTYSWPQLAGLAVTARAPRFAFEQLCATPPAAADPRSYVVAERSEVSNGKGQWQLRAQVLHWRGETWRGGQDAEATFAAAVTALRGCQATNPTASASLTVDQPDRFAAAISGPVVMHEYLVADPVNSTLTELTLWSDAPPLTPWPAVTDTAVLDALGAPLCTAYIDSCP